MIIVSVKKSSERVSVKELSLMGIFTNNKTVIEHILDLRYVLLYVVNAALNARQTKNLPSIHNAENIY